MCKAQAISAQLHLSRLAFLTANCSLPYPSFALRLGIFVTCWPILCIGTGVGGTASPSTRSRAPATPPAAAASATATGAATPRAGDLLLPDGDDLLGMTAHTPGDAGARGGFGVSARGGGGGMDAGEMGRMVERIVAAAGGGSGGGSGLGSAGELQGAVPTSPPSRQAPFHQDLA